VRYERLVIESGDSTLALDLHPKLTVISGVSRVERDGLVNELVGALGSGRSGVHLELIDDRGTRLAVFRPRGAQHRVVNIDAAQDVTDRYADADGRVDLLRPAGLDVRTARSSMRCGAADLLTSSERHQRVRQLAQLNQRELWAAVEEVTRAQLQLDQEAAALGSSAEDAEVIERIEARHAEFERHQGRSEQVRRATYLLAGFAAIGVVPAMSWFGLVAAIPLIVLAAAAVVTSIVCWRHAESSRTHEHDALAEAGAQSYLGFHIQRVNGLLSSDQTRKRLLEASEAQRDALRRWSIIAGTIEVEWVSRHRGEIDAAVRVRNDVMGSGFLPNSRTEHTEAATELAHSILARLDDLRQMGRNGETFPVIFDDPFANTEMELRPALFSLIARASEHQQVILLVEDADTAEWARLEAMTGELSLIEPSREIVELPNSSVELHTGV